MVRIRSVLSAEGKDFLRVTKPTSITELTMVLTQWVSEKRTLQSISQTHRKTGQNNSINMAFTCHYCGKPGHMQKDCRSQLRNIKKEPKDTPQTPQHSQTPPQSQVSKNNSRQANCFVCQKPGHRAMECPDRMQKAKKIKMLPTLEPRSIKLLDESEMMGEVRKLTLPTTLDTGAHYTLIPEGMWTQRTSLARRLS